MVARKYEIYTRKKYDFSQWQETLYHTNVYDIYFINISVIQSFLPLRIRYFLRVKISFYNTASFIYFVCSKNLDSFL